MMRAAFRVDGNSLIGMGHIMRCLSLADALVQFGSDVLFVVSDVSAVALIEERGYHCCSLDSKWNDYFNKIDEFCGLLRGRRIDWVITDSYYAPIKYFQKIKTLCKTVMISEDDPGDFAHVVDLFVNYNLYMKCFDATPVRRNCCLGPKYAILRHEFSNTPLQRGNALLILTGGSDPLNIAPVLVERMASNKDPDRKIIVVSGSANPNLKQLSRVCDREGVSLRIDVRNMAAVMQEAALAISAGGSTLYELCACGVPTVTYAFADNQIRNVVAFEKEGLMPYAGFYPDNSENVISKVAFFAKALLDDLHEQRKMARKLRAVCDGIGAERVAKCILALS